MIDRYDSTIEGRGGRRFLQIDGSGEEWRPDWHEHNLGQQGLKEQYMTFFYNNRLL